MKTLNKRARIMALGLMIAAAGSPATAQADDSKRFETRLSLSFAPQDPETTNDPFSQFDLHGVYEDAHEMNDAWLGMPVRDDSGNVVGYVEDALLDQEGYLTELIVSINGSGVMVYVDQQHVEYTEVGVLVGLPIQAIASLESAIGNAVE